MNWRVLAGVAGHRLLRARWWLALLFGRTNRIELTGQTMLKAVRSYSPMACSLDHRPSRMVMLSGVPAFRLSHTHPARQPCGRTLPRNLRGNFGMVVVMVRFNHAGYAVSEFCHLQK